MELTEKDKSRWKEKVLFSGSDECWIWTASCTAEGYGRIGLNGKTVGAHQMSYLINIGEIPDGMCICHSCDNRKCVNPKHLWAGTKKENTADMIAKGRQPTTFRRLRPEEIQTIRALRSSGALIRQIAERFGIGHRYISQIISGKYHNALLVTK